MFDEDGVRDLTPIKAGILGLSHGRWCVIEQAEFADNALAFGWAEDRGREHAKRGRYSKVRASVIDTEAQEIGSIQEVCDDYNAERCGLRTRAVW